MTKTFLGIERGRGGLQELVQEAGNLKPKPSDRVQTDTISATLGVPLQHCVWGSSLEGLNSHLL